MHEPQQKLAYLALLANALIWGSAFPIIKPALDYITPLQYLYLRFLVAGVISFPIFLYFLLLLKPKFSMVSKMLLLELLGSAFPLYILYEGLSRTSALEASLIGATGPVFIVLGGILFLRERQTKREWQGLALSFAATLLIVLEPILNGQTSLGTTLTGNLLILLYNFLYTGYVVALKKVWRSRPPLYFGSINYLGIALVYGLILASQNSLPSFALLLTYPIIQTAVLYMAIPGTILAFFLYLFAQSRIEVSEANLFTYLNGIVAIPAAYLLLGDTPSVLNLIAIILIAYGLYLAESRSRKS